MRYINLRFTYLLTYVPQYSAEYYFVYEIIDFRLTRPRMQPKETGFFVHNWFKRPNYVSFSVKQTLLYIMKHL